MRNDNAPFNPSLASQAAVPVECHLNNGKQSEIPSLYASADSAAPKNTKEHAR